MQTIATAGVLIKWTQEEDNKWHARFDLDQTYTLVVGDGPDEPEGQALLCWILNEDMDALDILTVAEPGDGHITGLELSAAGTLFLEWLFTPKPSGESVDAIELMEALS